MCDLTTLGLEVVYGRVHDTRGAVVGEGDDDGLPVGDDARDSGKAGEDSSQDTHFDRFGSMEHSGGKRDRYIERTSRIIKYVRPEAICWCRTMKMEDVAGGGVIYKGSTCK